MLPYEPKFPEEQSDIKELLEKRNISPQTVADFLKDHPHMYFGTADLTKDFARIILYSASIGQDKLAIFIAQEFSNEIDIGSLLFDVISLGVDVMIVDKILDLYKLPNSRNDKIPPIKIFQQTLKHIYKSNNTEWYELFENDEKFINSFTSQDFDTMFHFILRNVMFSSQVVEAMKKLYKYESFLKEMTRVASKDVNILKKYFPEASDIFLF